MQTSHSHIIPDDLLLRVTDVKTFSAGGVKQRNLLLGKNKTNEGGWEGSELGSTWGNWREWFCVIRPKMSKMTCFILSCVTLYVFIVNANKSPCVAGNFN